MIFIKSIFLITLFFGVLEADILLSEEQKAELRKKQQEELKYKKKRKVLHYSSPYAGGKTALQSVASDERSVLKSVELQKEYEKKAAKLRAKKAQQEKLKKEKIAKNFAKKSEVKEIKKKALKVKVVKKEADFFESLEKDNAPVNME